MCIKTLLMTGENNHDWERSALFCLDLMQSSGKFIVDLTEHPSETLANSAALSNYQLFFVDYNGSDWGDEAKANFEDRVRNGTGVCILHASNNSFIGWKAYEEMCALVWRDGSSHGSYHKFGFEITDPDHPITKGLPPILKDHPDELYGGLVHVHNTPYKVIASAYSAPGTGGTGKNEPVLVVKTYGKGRIFHCILGHVWEGGPMDTFDSPDFQRVLLGGCQWAATGKVTI
jgi:uncharacterized protein